MTDNDPGLPEILQFAERAGERISAGRTAEALTLVQRIEGIARKLIEDNSKKQPGSQLPGLQNESKSHSGD